MDLELQKKNKLYVYLGDHNYAVEPLYKGQLHTAEPLYNGQVPFVPYSEVVIFSEIQFKGPLLEGS